LQSDKFGVLCSIAWELGRGAFFASGLLHAFDRGWRCKQSFRTVVHSAKAKEQRIPTLSLCKFIALQIYPWVHFAKSLHSCVDEV